MESKLGVKVSGQACVYMRILTDDLADDMNDMFNHVVAIPRSRHRFKQTLDVLISKEAILFGKYLREEKTIWIPRITNL